MQRWGTVVVAGVMVAGAACGSGETEGATRTEPRTSSSVAPASGRAGWRRVPFGPLSPRQSAQVFWTGREVLVLGGSDAPPCPPNADCAPSGREPLRDGAALDPATGAWRPIAPAPVALIWFGGVVVRGDLYLSASVPAGADTTQPKFLAYRVAADRWDELPPPPSDESFTLVAAGDRIVAFAPSEELGARPDLVFDLKDRTWSELPDDPLTPSFDREMVWTGDQLVLTAIEAVPSPGSEKPSIYRAATYDFDTARWSRLPDSEVVGYDVRWYWVGGRVVNPTLGAADGGSVNNWGRFYSHGGMLDPVAARWLPLPDPPTEEPMRRLDQFFGLTGASDTVAVNGQGWLLDVEHGRWTMIPRPEGAPEDGFSSVWTDSGLFVFGGATWTSGNGALLADAWLWSPPAP